MIMKTRILAAAVVAVVFGFAGAAAVADDCDAMTGGVKVLIDKMDPAAKGGNNRQSCARPSAKASE